MSHIGSDSISIGKMRGDDENMLLHSSMYLYEYRSDRKEKENKIHYKP
jgi:hypothetical protein